ncbi:MAG: M20/M25/M40 family metallo-hydrolase [Opitutae bacterium]|nr:M20/M25/M40 family metallo-hydrolase [Opitutae bacterium]
MRLPTFLPRAALLTALVAPPLLAQTPARDDAQTLRALYSAALPSRAAYDNLTELVTQHPGRLSGSKSLEGAVRWGEAALKRAGAERTELQPVMVPHWERGAPENVNLVKADGSTGAALTAVALGGSVPTPAGGLRAPVVELHTLAELPTADVKGKIVFFNRAMNPDYVNTGRAYGEAGDARNKGAAAAAKFGAVGVLTRSLTLALDDVPHTGYTGDETGAPAPIPAAALSTEAANHLSAQLRLDPSLTVELQINSQWFPDAPSHNVVGEIRGSEFPDEIILVGGHLDSWDITPGAHDDGAGVVESIEVLRLLKAIGYRPRHTIRAVLFTSEENSGNGGKEYARLAGAKKERHLLALESDNGGFQPVGFNLGSPAGDAHTRAARWQELFAPYGIHVFRAGRGGADVEPLLETLGYPVAELVPDSQRYFDYHHTRIDTMDKVNPRELALGAAAMAALVYLVDQHGL